MKHHKHIEKYFHGIRNISKNIKEQDIENLAKAYTEGNFDMAKDYFAEEGVHYVNNDEYTNDESTIIT